MTTQETSAANPLEALLAQMHGGRLDATQFARQLVDVQIFVPVRDEKHQIAGFQRSTRADPLIVDDEDGNRVLVVFSTPERARAFAARYPAFSGGLVTEFSWLLRRMGRELAIAINPGEELGIDLDTEMVAMLVGLLPEGLE